MKIKIIIANNSDILHQLLCNIASKNKEKIEIIKIPQNNLEKVIYKTRNKENLIILDSTTSTIFCKNILKNTIFIGNMNIIILVINSKNIANIINTQKNYSVFSKNHSFFSILNVMDMISKTLKDSLEIEKKIDTIFWKIGLNSYLKGTIYLKDAISFTYNDKNLLLNIQNLVKKIAIKNNISNHCLVRSDMDKTLNNALDLLEKNILYDTFGDDYDGRKISLRYFIDLCIHHLEKYQEKNISV